MAAGKKVTENAPGEISNLGKELYDRVRTFCRAYAKKIREKD